ncbi:uncharacterized protein FIESC28_10575 [Fusarium coffeatum]|uniref:Amidoligase enzyme n=1 Tax=Fusarium coffeatum TaxID=231269 RepID=A0A366QU71_9HYPO|nr:uncharacterized protein FIESC28_10575 [Fusarium coffeatum]RBR07676.1 hypothetical protein FIESC28_10575 [Fusarium coffeatum]
MEQTGKIAAQYEGHKADSTQQDNYTRPPRVSFGVELEFLVACIAEDGKDSCRRTTLEARIHHIKPRWPRLRGATVDPCYIDWLPVEISSPPMYSCEEAYNLVSSVIRLLTTNLRVRVNPTCGLHVHVGNGSHQLDMRALRNYAALLWASESVLSTLHCPERTLPERTAMSIRRCHRINLAIGATAEQARHEILKLPKIVPRYISRARRLGEHPVASHGDLRKLLHTDDDDQMSLVLEYDGDDSDWEKEESEPFHRPKRPQEARRETLDRLRNMELCSEERGALLDSETTRRELPPQINFSDSKMKTDSRTTGQAPLLDNERTKVKGYTPAELGANTTWKGIAELLACDVGVHQIAYLMTERDGSKTYKYHTTNWTGQSANELFPLRRRDTHPTIESRLASGSLDAEWVVTWIKIQCRMLEWARDADSSQFMNVLCKLSDDDHSKECTYDVLDFLRDIGMYTELKHCQERLRRADEAWHECMLLENGNTSLDSELEREQFKWFFESLDEDSQSPEEGDKEEKEQKEENQWEQEKEEEEEEEEEEDLYSAN